MIFKNNWNFGGEIVRLKDFGDGKGGNMTIRGITDIGGLIEVSVFMAEKIFQRIVDRDNYKYQKINVNGHFEIKVHETSGNNIKQTLKLMADDFQWIS